MERPDAMHSEIPRFSPGQAPSGERSEPLLDIIFDPCPLPPLGAAGDA